MNNISMTTCLRLRSTESVKETNRYLSAESGQASLLYSSSLGWLMSSSRECGRIPLEKDMQLVKIKQKK